MSTSSFVTMHGSTISGCTASSIGGGLGATFRSTLTVSDCSFAHNLAPTGAALILDDTIETDAISVTVMLIEHDCSFGVSEAVLVRDARETATLFMRGVALRVRHCGSLAAMHAAVRGIDFPRCDGTVGLADAVDVDVCGPGATCTGDPVLQAAELFEGHTRQRMARLMLDDTGEMGSGDREEMGSGDIEGSPNIESASGSGSLLVF